MKEKSNSKVMRRKQERLWEQRRPLCVQQRVRGLQSEQEAQWRMRAETHNRTELLWNCDDDGVVTPQEIMSSRLRCDLYRRELNEEQLEVRRTMEHDGSTSRSTIGCFTVTESWETLSVQLVKLSVMMSGGLVTVVMTVAGTLVVELACGDREVVDGGVVGTQAVEPACGDSEVDGDVRHRGGLGGGDDDEGLRVSGRSDGEWHGGDELYPAPCRLDIEAERWAME
ncbi:reverse transcriptase [Phytophthora cinnamomi]|uniref:reverse transcriptase n=1 Tax=Phytophthora cinnamomi TaxID=4785 RepID=UPI00355A6471|nr:reverse transcriptase [Phytophthora cinnamomi]